MRSDSADVHHNLGFAYLESGRLDDALASFDSALQLRPQYASAHNNKGTVFLRKGRFKRRDVRLRGDPGRLRVQARLYQPCHDAPSSKRIEKLAACSAACSR